MRWHRQTENAQKEKGMKEYTNSQIAQVIDEYIHNQRDRDVLKSRFIDGLTYEKIAEKYELSVRYTKTIIYKQQDVIFKHI